MKFGRKNTTMKEKAKNQPTLFDLSVIPQEPHYPRKKWYYIVDARSQMMVVGVAPDGELMWSEHDTRTGVGLYPHVFNTRKEAERVGNIPRSGRKIKEYWYSA